MNYNASEFPALPRESSRPTQVVVDANVLNQIGLSAGAYSMHVGDKITFDVYQENGNPVVKQQKLENGVANYIACHRNGKPSWISAGSLGRLDSEMQPVGDFEKGYREALRSGFCSMFASYLKDKTITATTTVEKTFNVFGKDGETEKRQIPVITLA